MREPGTAGRELDGLRARRDALRQAAGLPDAELRPSLDAALAELDVAIDALAAARQRADGPPGGQPPEARHAEQRLLRAMFQDAPVPLFLLGPDGVVRRVNRAAGELLGVGTGYATGKPFAAFTGLPSRAALQSQLAAVLRTGGRRQLPCELLTADGTLPCELTAGPAVLRGDADQLLVAVRAHPPGSTGQRAGKPETPDTQNDRAGPAVVAITRRLDLVTAVTRLLLDTATLDEAVTLQRCARLLADELAAWAIVDVLRGDELRRQFVTGPDDPRSAELAAEVAACDPQAGSVPLTVGESGSSQLIAHAEDPGILGDGPRGVPFLMLLSATSVLSVPLSDGERTYGVLTLARNADEGHFEIADLGLVEELGEQLALAIRVDRMVQRYTGIAHALRASLLPRQLPGIPGAEVATAHRPAAGSPEVGGDFYDVYRAGPGWGVAIGDVGGRGDGVAAASAAARHAIRVLAQSGDDPATVLTRANEIVLAEEFGGRLVTACAAHAQWAGDALHVTLGSAGHPGPVLVRPDGRTHRLSGGGQPLGIFADAGPASQECDLHPGDALIFFTDGLADARGPGGEPFDDRLTGEAAALAGQPPGEITARLRDLAVEFCRGESRDDMTVLVLRVGEPPAPVRRERRAKARADQAKAPEKRAKVPARAARPRSRRSAEPG